MSGNAFTNTKRINGKQAIKIAHEFNDLLKTNDTLKKLLNFKQSFVIGSLRKIAMYKNHKFKKLLIPFTNVGDIDISILINDIENNFDNIKNEIIQEIEYNFKFECKTFLSNIISINFDKSKIINFPIQIDIMLAKNMNEHYYINNLRYFNNESLFNKNIKGLHRTELIRSLLKNEGYSLGMTCIKQYKWNYKFYDIGELLNDIKEKYKKARSNESKNDWKIIFDWIKSFYNIRNLQYALCKKYNRELLRSRLFIDKYIMNNIVNENALNKLIDLLFDKNNLNEKHYIEYLREIFKEFDFNTFESTLETMKFNINDYVKYDFIHELKRKKPNQYNKTIERLLK